MQVVALLGGLGSQMFKYAFYLALCEKTAQKCYIDTSFFNSVRPGSWNGYELEKIFSIKAPDINDITCDILTKTKRNWYPERAIEYMTKYGEVAYFDRGIPTVYPQGYPEYGIIKKIILRYRKQRKKRIQKHRLGVDRYPDEFYKLYENAYYDECELISDEYFEEYKDKIVEAFTFPDFRDEKNKFYANKMMNENSIAMHVRRSDHMYDNQALFSRRFFAKSVELIRKKLFGQDCIWYLFSDDLEWCMKNKEELGLLTDDAVVTVDWNRTEDSYRDMQLMTYCQHNIIPKSSFSWWGYYLSKRENKVVCAPLDYWTDVEYHF